MTEISKLKATPAALLVVAGLAYFSVLAFFTWRFVALAFAGHASLFLLGFVLVWVYCARIARTWAGLAISGFALEFRGLYVKDGRLVYIAPWVRSFELKDIERVEAVQLRAGANRAFLEFRIKNGGKWRLPGFLLTEGAQTAAERVRRTLKA